MRGLGERLGERARAGAAFLKLPPRKNRRLTRPLSPFFHLAAIKFRSDSDTGPMDNDGTGGRRIPRTIKFI